MILHHGDRVSMHDKSGHLELRGKIVGIYGVNPNFYDIQPDAEFSLKERICGVQEARIRKYVPVTEEANEDC